MSISFGDSQRRYGNLAQADNYDGLACVPTSITNALLALNLDALMQDPSRPASWESLYATRNKLAEDYFYTSKYWQNFPSEYSDGSFNPGIAKSLNPALPDPTFINKKQTGGYAVAQGTVPSMMLKGMLSYFEDQGLNDAITLTATGLIKGKAGANTFNFAGFDVTTTINNQTYTTPSQNDLSNTFAAAKNGDSQNNLDFLMANLERGPVVFGMYYTNEPGGHAVLATHLDLNDTNANGILEKNEGSKIWFIDPLNPGSSYDPSVESSSNPAAFNQIKTLGAAKPTSATIWQDTNGFLMIEYAQKSLVLRDGTIQLSGGDSSNGTTTTAPDLIDAAITMAAGLSTSGLASDFDRQAGRLATTTPGLIDFSFLRADSDTNTKTLSGQAYANESSALTNNYFYFECLNTEGSIATVDSITGLTTTLKPGDANYANAAWELAQQFSASGGALSLGERQSQDEAMLTAFSVDIAKLSTGYLAPITKTSNGDIWVPFSAGNSDNEQHYLSTGHLSWRMEDLSGLGDQDFNDLHVSILINSIS